MMVFLPLKLTTDKERFNPQGEKEEVAFRAAIFRASEREPDGGRSRSHQVQYGAFGMAGAWESCGPSKTRATSTLRKFCGFH
jgi:hypothetical protein